MVLRASATVDSWSLPWPCRGASAGGEFAHADLFAMAAAYAFHIAQNQPFVDGNKRTGLLTAIVFISLNGVEIADPAGSLYDAMIAIAERRMDKSGLAAALWGLVN